MITHCHTTGTKWVGEDLDRTKLIRFGKSFIHFFFTVSPLPKNTSLGISQAKKVKRKEDIYEDDIY